MTEQSHAASSSGGDQRLAGGDRDGSAAPMGSRPARSAARSYRREWIQHGIVIFVCLAAVGVLTYLAYFGAWSHA